MYKNQLFELNKRFSSSVCINMIELVNLIALKRLITINLKKGNKISDKRVVFKRLSQSNKLKCP